MDRPLDGLEQPLAGGEVPPALGRVLGLAVPDYEGVRLRLAEALNLHSVGVRARPVPAPLATRGLQPALGAPVRDRAIRRVVLGHARSMRDARQLQAVSFPFAVRVGGGARLQLDARAAGLPEEAAGAGVDRHLLAVDEEGGAAGARPSPA